MPQNLDDIRVFAASNAAAFLLLVLVSFLRPEHTRALFVPGVLLTISTLLCAWLYVFEQNWLLTIIHGDYLGLAYTAWLGAVFLLLCDVWLNRARITIRIVESIASTAGAIVSSMNAYYVFLKYAKLWQHQAAPPTRPGQGPRPV